MGGMGGGQSKPLPPQSAWLRTLRGDLMEIMGSS
jgi:hypothetical protein